jgi:hypothetical protein
MEHHPLIQGELMKHAFETNRADATINRHYGSLFGSLLDFHASLLTHGGQDNDVAVLALISEHLVDSVTNFTIGNLDIILGATVVVHEGEEAIVGNVEKLVFTAGDVGDVHVVGGRAQFFKLLASEDVDGDKVDLGVTVLTGLGGGHVDDLAGAALDDDETVLPQSGTLHGEGGRGASVGGLEGNIVLRPES